MRAFVDCVYILKFFLRSCWKSPKLAHQTFFWPTEKQKTLGPKSSAIWVLWRHLTFKIDLHPPGTPKSSKNQFCWSKNAFLEGFGVPGGCKSILNVKCFHKSYIAELFGPRVFCFSVGRKIQKSHQKWRFCGDLKKNFNMIFSSHVGSVCANLVAQTFGIVFLVAYDIF